MGLFFPYIYKNTGSVEIVSWADGTEDQIQAMLDAAFAGKINLSDYWSVGDERVIHHSAMAATGVGESHAEQDATWVIMDTGENSGYVFEDDTPVHFVVGMKDCFVHKGYINSTQTNAGSWESCARRVWCNNVLPGSFPAKTKSFFKPFKVKTASENNSDTITVTTDTFALFAEKEIVGTSNYGRSSEAAVLKLIKYFETNANRAKRANGNLYPYWNRSPRTNNINNFTLIQGLDDPGSTAGYATVNHGISPFGCI